MGAVFIGAHAAVADLKHVRIVPVSRAGVFGDSGLRICDLHHALVGVIDVAGGAPEVAAGFIAPCPNIVAAVLAQAVHDGAVGGVQRFAHLLVHGTHGRVGIEVAGATPVVLEVIDAPFSVGFCVLGFVAVAAFITGAGVRTGRGVDAELQSLGGNIVGERLHVGELLVAMNNAFGVAVALPGVVDVEVDVSGIAHTAGDEGIGHFADRLVVNLAREEIPAVPAHRGRLGKAVGREIFDGWR